MDKIRKYQEAAQEQYTASQYDKLRDLHRVHTIKKMQTCFIHAIDQAEQKFGHLWKDDIEDESVELTPEEKKFFELFMEFRKCVLDMGNKQIRNYELDIERYQMRYKE